MQTRGGSAAGKPQGDERATAIDRLPGAATLGCASRDLLNLPCLAAFFGDRPLEKLSPSSGAALGWGLKRSGKAAEAFAGRTGRPFALLEDGFLRSVGLGKAGASPVSLVVDDCGMYYDASRPSRLEKLIADSPSGDAAIRAAAPAALDRWRREGLSKYNIGSLSPPPAARGKIILADQVRGDLSVAGAGAGPETFRAMVQAALDEGLADRIVVRAHPDVVAGKAQGCLFDMARAAGLAILADDCAPPALLKEAAAIWTVSSALGFEAILQGVPVTTFAAPFYAGWGLTDDRATGATAQRALARRRMALGAGPLTPENLFAAAMLQYARYVDPVLERATDFHGAVDRILDWRRRDAENAGPTLLCYGFSPWKRRACAALLGGTARKIVFSGAPKPWRLRQAAQHPGAEIAVWGIKDNAAFRNRAQALGLKLNRVEDGFLRSVGLGADLLPPGSVVLDGPHLYYDAGGPSRLETLLETTEFPAELEQRAADLAERIVSRSLTKYNLSSETPDLRAAAGARPVVAVIEQVPGDAAIVLGGGCVGPNLDLLEKVRAARPGAFIVYKEHPDLVSGNRKGRTPLPQLQARADLVLSSGDLGRLYAQIDELHVITSLAGFEGLLRGVKVATWGMPFYAGWGLTEDRVAALRRTRRLTLPQLVAGALILYPRYINPQTMTPCTVEDFLSAIESQRARPAPKSGVRLWGRSLRYVRGMLQQLAR